METKDTKIKIIIKCTAKAAITIEATISLTLFMFVVVFLAAIFWEEISLMQVSLRVLSEKNSPLQTGGARFRK